MCLNRATGYCCRCVHITTFTYVVLMTTLCTHSGVTIFFLTYALWWFFIPLGVTLLAHALAIDAIRHHSHRLFLLFMIYEACFIIGLIATTVWFWVVMEIKPKSSFFAKDCYAMNIQSTSCNTQVRKRAGIAGAVTCLIGLVNAVIIWPLLRNCYRFLRFTPRRTYITTVTTPPPAVIELPPAAAPSATNLPGSTGGPCYTGYPPAQPLHQPYTIHHVAEDQFQSNLQRQTVSPYQPQPYTTYNPTNQSSAHYPSLSGEYYTIAREGVQIVAPTAYFVHGYSSESPNRPEPPPEYTPAKFS